MALAATSATLTTNANIIKHYCCIFVVCDFVRGFTRRPSAGCCRLLVRITYAVVNVLLEEWLGFVGLGPSSRESVEVLGLRRFFFALALPRAL